MTYKTFLFRSSVIVDVQQLGGLNFKQLSQNYKIFYDCDFHMSDNNYICSIKNAKILKKYLLDLKTMSVISPTNTQEESYDTTDTKAEDCEFQKHVLFSMYN